MYFDFRLWRLTAGLRGAMAGGIALGLLALGAGIARYVFLGQMLARVFGHAPWREWLAPAAGVAAMVLLRAALDHWRTVAANRCAAQVQQTLRGRLYDRIVALGPAWFAQRRTGGVMLTVVDGVEQLQTFFGQYLPQLAISAAAPFAIFAVMACWDVPVALVFLFAPTFLNYFYLSSCVALVQEEVRPEQRVLSGALLLLVMNLVGIGVGPTFVGAVSDAVRASHPAHSLQIGFYALLPFYALAIVLFVILAAVLRGEDRRAQGVSA